VEIHDKAIIVLRSIMLAYIAKANDEALVSGFQPMDEPFESEKQIKPSQ